VSWFRKRARGQLYICAVHASEGERRKPAPGNNLLPIVSHLLFYNRGKIVCSNNYLVITLRITYVVHPVFRHCVTVNNKRAQKATETTNKQAIGVFMISLYILQDISYG
jgi:hypothetical protein